MDESRDNKTDVIRHVLAQPAMQGKRVLMVGDRRDDMQGAVNCAWTPPLCSTATAAGKRSPPLRRSSWPLTAKS